MTSRYIVVGSGSHEAAALVLDQLATAFGASSSVARVPAFAGTDADSAALGAASALPDAVGAVRERTADVVLIESSSACANGCHCQKPTPGRIAPRAVRTRV